MHIYFFILPHLHSSHMHTYISQISFLPGFACVFIMNSCAIWIDSEHFYFVFKDLAHFLNYMCICVGSICMNVSAYRGQKMIPDPLELGVTCGYESSVWVLGTQSQLFERTVYVLNCWAIYLCSHWLVLIGCHKLARSNWTCPVLLPREVLCFMIAVSLLPSHSLFAFLFPPITACQ